MEDFIEELKEEELSALEDNLDLRERLMNHFKAGTAWFFWIAGISLFISLIPLVGWRFLTSIFELGFSQYIEYEAAGIVRQLQPDSANIVKGAAALLALEVTGLFVLFGVLSRKGYQWAMITGIIIYILDGYFVFRAGSFFGIFFHLIPLFGLIRGLHAYRDLESRYGEEIFRVSNGAAAGSRKERWPDWMKYVLPPVLLLLTPVMIFYLAASENGSIFLIQLATMIFTAAVSVKKKQQLRPYQRWFIPLLIGGQILTLVLLAFVLWPETAFGEAGKLNAAKDFMRAMTSGNSNAAILMIPKEDASEETYDLIIRELTNPENSPTYWELEEPDIFNRIEGRIIVPDGVYLDVVLRVRWEWTKARWVISGVDFGGEAATSIIKFDLYDRSTPFDYVKIGVNTLALACLLFSTVYILLNASFFIKPLWRRIGL